MQFFQLHRYRRAFLSLAFIATTGVFMPSISAQTAGRSSAGPTAQSADPQDKYLWLEDVNGERALSWVRAENDRSAKVLEADPRFAPLEADALKVLESPDRLPL